MLSIQFLNTLEARFPSVSMLLSLPSAVLILSLPCFCIHTKHVNQFPVATPMSYGPVTLLPRYNIGQTTTRKLYQLHFFFFFFLGFPHELFITTYI